MRVFANSPDGKRIAYEVCGSGPALILLHGGGGNRQEWYAAGYVQRLISDFTVITLDLRGHGESGASTTPEDYTIPKLVQDILAVADACGVEHFCLWVMSYGGKVGRYVAVLSERVDKFVLMGTPLGPGVTGQLRQAALDFYGHWPAIVQAQNTGTLNLATLSPNDQEMLGRLNIPAMLGWVRAMLDWPAVAPADFRCPTLWLVGSQDEHAMESLQAYHDGLTGSQVQAHILDGLDHEQVFDAVETVFPALLAFTRCG